MILNIKKYFLKNKKNFFKIGSIVLLIGVISFLIYMESDYHKYKTATKMYNEGNYEEAIKIYKKIKNYKDSKDKIIETKYQYGKQLITDKDFTEAIKIFEELGEYEETKELLVQAKYQYAKELISKEDDIGEEDYTKAIEIFTALNAYEDSKELLKEGYYLYGKYLRNNYKYEISTEQFNKILDYKDSQDYIKLNNEDIIEDKLSEFLKGTWKSGNDYLVFTDYWSLTDYFKSFSIWITKYSCDIVDEKTLECSPKGTSVRNDITIKINDNSITFYEKEDDPFFTPRIAEYQKDSDETDIPNGFKEPKIGMTKEEVRNSSWGSPEDINTYTYYWGTQEQWVYDNFKYIYFENGIVTSISD